MRYHAKMFFYVLMCLFGIAGCIAAIIHASGRL